MIRTVRGCIHGKTIELDEDPGVAEGQRVEIQITVDEPRKPRESAMSPGLRAIYAILGERFDTGEHDVAQRHNEHQP